MNDFRNSIQAKILQVNQTGYQRIQIQKLLAKIIFLMTNNKTEESTKQCWFTLPQEYNPNERKAPKCFHKVY